MTSVLKTKLKVSTPLPRSLVVLNLEELVVVLCGREGDTRLGAKIGRVPDQERTR